MTETDFEALIWLYEQIFLSIVFSLSVRKKIERFPRNLKFLSLRLFISSSKFKEICSTVICATRNDHENTTLTWPTMSRIKHQFKQLCSIFDNYMTQKFRSRSSNTACVIPS